jgi:signal recognition particle subunit SRP54
MFEVLSDKLNAVFRKLSGKGKLSEKDIDEGLRQVRLALLDPPWRRHEGFSLAVE